MPDQRLGQAHQHAAAGAVVAAECGGAVRDDAAALHLRPGAPAQGNGVEMRREQQVRALGRAWQVDDQVARLRGHRNARVGIIEPNGAPRHAGLHQLVDHGLADGLLLTGHPVDGEKAHQPRFGGRRIQEISG